MRRNRRLVVSSWFTVGNYDCETHHSSSFPSLSQLTTLSFAPDGVRYMMYPDGNLEVDISLSGIVGVSAAVDQEGGDGPVSPQEYAPRIAADITSPVHQHLFSLRLDWELDGTPNTLLEVEVEPVPIGPGNEHGTQFRQKTKMLETELGAKRMLDNSKNRQWKVLGDSFCFLAVVATAGSLATGCCRSSPTT